MTLKWEDFKIFACFSQAGGANLYLANPVSASWCEKCA